MQTLFRNPLADPYILGLSAGASLGVGLVVLSSETLNSRLIAGGSALQNLSLVAAAALGAAIVLAVMLVIAARVQGTTILLIIGVMIGALAELPGSHTNATLPLNAATALIGAPVVVWVLLRMWRHSSRRVCDD